MRPPIALLFGLALITAARYYQILTEDSKLIQITVVQVVKEHDAVTTANNGSSMALLQEETTDRVALNTRKEKSLAEKMKPSQPETSTASDIIDITSCSSADRRALALAFSASEAQWKAMTECTIREQTHNKLGHFFLHVSKSGGTSMRAAWDQTNCVISGRDKKKKLPHVLESTQLQWFKQSRLEKEGLKMKFGRIHTNTERVQGFNCSSFQGAMERQGRLALESEWVVPFEAQQQQQHAGGGGCRKLVNSIIFREPMARILSHYKHLELLARGGTKKKMKMKGNNRIFNVDFMTKVFDVLSDNYYTRSLVAHGIYEWEHTNQTLTQHPEAWTKIWPTANASLHNMDWVMLMGSSNESEEADRNLIIRNGLGLAVNLGHNRTGSTKQKQSKLSDEQRLRDMNALDYKLWEEALELNRLDVVSLNRMKPYYEAALEATKLERNDHCCGLVCWKK